MPFAGHTLESGNRYGSLTRWQEVSGSVTVAGGPLTVDLGFHNCSTLTVIVPPIGPAPTQPMTLDLSVRLMQNFRQFATLSVPAAGLFTQDFKLAGQEIRASLTLDPADAGPFDIILILTGTAG